MVKVSIIMPVYNAEEYLAEALECLIHQTLKEIEIICVDDGSTDRSHKVLDKYAAMDSRVLVLSQENSGAGAARNLGLPYATGEYLSILDSDDMFELDMLESAYMKAKRDEVDICVFKMDRFKEDIEHRQPYHWSILRNQLPHFEPFNYKDIQGNIFRVFIGWTWDKLFRREFVLENRLVFQELRNTDDMFFTFTAFVKAEKISILSRTLVHKRVGLNSSVSSTRESSWDCFYQALLALRQELTRIGIYKEVEKSYINYALHFSLWNLETLKMPAFEALYEKLKNEIFMELGISDKKKKYFWNQEEYKKYKQIKMFSSEEYRILNGMQTRYREMPYQIRQMNKSIMPKVSILIPIYNVEGYLIECLNSVVNQTLEDIEIICINDGSTDNSLKIVERFAAEDKRIVILDGPNGGYGRAMNRGLDAATGDYIGIVEPDDYVECEMYETLYKIAVKEKLDLIKADFNRFMDVNGKRKVICNQIAKANVKLYNQVISPSEYPIIFKFILNTWSGIYKRSYINKNCIRHNETPGASYQDIGFWFQTFCYAERIYFLDKVFYQKRGDNPNSSVYDSSKVYCMCEEYQYIYDFLERHPKFKEQYIGYYQHSKYYNYIFTFNKTLSEERLEFIKRFHKEFKASYEKGELPEEVFWDAEWDAIRELIESPMDFYAHLSANQKELQLRQEIDLIKTSKSWKIGSAVVYLPKKILGR